MKELYKKLLNEVEDEHTQLANRTRNSNVMIIDGMNTFIRLWCTVPTMNEDGDHVGGLIGSLKSIGNNIRMFNPSRVIIVFDGKGGSDKRKKVFSGYKSDRGKNRFRVNRQYPEMMDEEAEHKQMRNQFVWLADMLDSLPVTTMIYEGIEADDVMAYIANTIVGERGKSIIVSTDKDFLQLVNDNTSVYSPTKKKLYTPQTVFDDFGVYPQNLLLVRTIDGDTSDNIPGVKGVGVKTLLKKYPELTENIKVDFDTLFELSNQRKNDSKVYSQILESNDIILRNQSLMQLSDSMISGVTKMKILDRFNEPNRKFDKFNFIKVASKYKILQSWNDVNDWLKSSFSNIIIN